MRLSALSTHAISSWNFGHSRGCNKASIILVMRRFFLSFAGFTLLSVLSTSYYSRSFLPRECLLTFHLCPRSRADGSACGQIWNPFFIHILKLKSECFSLKCWKNDEIAKKKIFYFCFLTNFYFYIFAYISLRLRRQFVREHSAAHDSSRLNTAFSQAPFNTTTYGHSAVG